MASLYLGCTFCEVDREGNLLLADGTAAALGLPAADESLFLSAHGRDRCLVGYARAHLQEMPGAMQRLLGIVEVAPRAGRGIPIPRAMRHLGGIESVALVVGGGDRFEIWNPGIAMTYAGLRTYPQAMADLPCDYRHPPRAGSRRARPMRIGL